MPILGNDIHRLFDLVVEKNASDLHLTVGRPPCIRLHGGLRNINHPPLTSGETTALIEEIIPAAKLAELREGGSADFGFAHSEKARFLST